MDVELSELRKLYSQRSKHSNYQILSKRLTEIIGDDIVAKSRYEAERLDYILSKVNVRGKTILDIGGNTGFFTFEMMEHGARSVHYYDGNEAHACFVQMAAQYLGLGGNVEIHNQYFSFGSENPNIKYDLALLLNVLHHLGDDYGDNKLSRGAAKKAMLDQLNSLAEVCDTIVLQIGFNWKGNRDLGLFESGTKKELIEFIKDGTEGYWEIQNIGIAERPAEIISYNELNESNIGRQDELGEFLNRPLFILRSMRW